MTEKQVILSETVRLDIGKLSDFIIRVSRPEHAEQYTQNLLNELATLSYNHLQTQTHSHFPY